MGLTTAERNKRKRERKKREREERRKQEEAEEAARKRAAADDGAGTEATGSATATDADTDVDVEVEYVAAPLALPAELLGGAGTSTGSAEVKKEEGGAAVAAGGGGIPDGVPTGKPSAGRGAAADASQNDDREGDQDDGDDDNDIAAVLRRFQSRAAVLVTDDEATKKEEEEDAGGGGGGGGAAARRSGHDGDEYNSDADADDEGEGGSGIPSVSNRKRREMERPTVAELKNRVKRSDLVEAHDVTAMDPDFLIELKSVPGTVAVPRHWGRKRKYLQGKRGIEKPPFQLPDFIVATGICDVRDAASEDQDKMSLKQKNRARVSGRGGMDVDYRVLHDAFFKHQTKPKSMTKFGDLYYEGKEFETKKSSDLQVGKMSERLRDGLGMTTSTAPPPWLVNMQRYGPPPSYPNLKIPGLNAPLPEGCSYGYHVNGWGKPPVDAYGRPLYGGDPFGRPTPEGGVEDDDGGPLGGTGGVAGLITSDGKTIGKKSWGALPTAEESEEEEESSDEEEESSGEEMAESSEEEEGEEGEEKDTMAPPPSVPGTESVLPPGGVDSVVPGSAVDLRKAPGAETPMEPKQLYQVVEQKAADGDTQAGAVFKSDVAYVVPGSAGAAAAPGGLVPEGAESVLSKAPMDSKTGKRKHDRLDDEEDADDLGKKFKF